MGFIAPVIKFLVVAYQSSAVFAFAVKLVAVVALNALTSKLFGPELPKEGFTGPQIMVRSAIEFRKIVYGQALISGPVAYNNLDGSTGQYIWYQIALCEGEIDSVVSVHFDGDVIAVADIDWTAGVAGADGTGTGEVTDSTFVGDNSTSAATVFWALGHEDQVASAALTTPLSDDFDSNSRMRGVAWLAARLLYDKDTEEVWKAGAPGDIRALVKGRKLYDPRLDSTQVILTTYTSDKTLALYRGAYQPAEQGGGGSLNLYRGAVEPAANTGADVGTETFGSGSHRTTDSSTWEWSENPALAVADYLVTVMGVATTAIDWETIAAAADDCEEQVAIPPSASPQVAFEDRFTCNGVISLGDSHKDNLDQILSSMDGSLTRSQGVWKLRSSKWQEPTITITEDDVAGTVDLRGSAPTEERFNKIIGIFIDPTRNHEVTEFQPVSSTAYLARDNSIVRKRNLTLPMTNSDTMAQRIAFRLMERGNNQQTVKIPLNTRGAKIGIGDVIKADLPSLGWVDSENILLQSESLATSPWTSANGSVSENTDTTAEGFMLADAFSENTGASQSPHHVTQAITVEDNTVYTFDFEIKKSNRTWAVAFFTMRDGTNIFCYFNLEDGQIGTPDPAVLNVRMINQGDDWYRGAITANLGSGGTSEAVTIGPAEGDSDRAFVGAGQESIRLGRFAVYEGAELKPYTKTTNTTVTSTKKNLRCIEWTRAESGVYELTFREEDEIDFTDPLVSQYTTTNKDGITQVADGTPPPTDLTVTAVPNGVQLDWVMPPAAGYDYIEIYESELPNRLDSPNATLIAQARGNQHFLARDPGFVGFYWIRGVRAPSIYSTYEPDTSVSDVTTTAGSSAGASFIGGDFMYVSTAPTNAKVGYRINSGDGTEEYFEGETSSPAPWTSLGNFVQSGGPADIEVYMEDLGTGSVTPSGSAVDTWIDATDNPYWFVEQTTVASPNDYDTFNGRIKARNKWTQVEFDNAKNVTLRAQQSGSGLVVEAKSTNIVLSTTTGICYAGVQFNSDGQEYRNQHGGSQNFTSVRGTWLTAGLASNVWVERVVTDSDGGGLDWVDAGAGRLNLGTSRNFGLLTTSGPTFIDDIDYVDITFNFYDAASGGNLLDSVSYTMTAIRSEFL